MIKWIIIFPAIKGEEMLSITHDMPSMVRGIQISELVKCGIWHILKKKKKNSEIEFKGMLKWAAYQCKLVY